jgi:Flp pilus assembly protein TadD
LAAVSLLFFQSLSLAQFEGTFHQVPKKARKAFEQAEKASRRGDRDQAIQYLQKAVAIDPEFLQAHNNLGAGYLAARQNEQARFHLLRALELHENAAEVHSNLSYLALAENNLKEAEARARRALALGTDPVATGYFLGLALLGQQRTAEARPLLEQAATRFPSVRTTLYSLFPPQNQR